MELVKGIDLGAVLKRDGDPGLTLGDGIEYARHGCEALQYVHDQQIVHRDVKPPNMILADEGVILVDFGVARALGGEQEEGTIAVGTPRFMAPEVLAGGTVSAASDVTARRHAVDAAHRHPAALAMRPSSKIAPGWTRAARRARGQSQAARSASPSAGGLRRGDRRARSTDRGESLAQSPGTGRSVGGHGAIVRTAAGMFDAAACSIALTDPGRDSSAGAWAPASRGGRPACRRAGLAGRGSSERARGARVPQDPRWAPVRQTGYVPYTMVVSPLVRDGQRSA
jgi:hypothetical protein